MSFASSDAIIITLHRVSFQSNAFKDEGDDVRERPYVLRGAGEWVVLTNVIDHHLIGLSEKLAGKRKIRAQISQIV